MISRRGRPVSRLNLSPSPVFLLFDIEAGAQPSPLRSSNAALSGWSSVIAASQAALSSSVTAPSRPSPGNGAIVALLGGGGAPV